MGTGIKKLPFVNVNYLIPYLLAINPTMSTGNVRLAIPQTKTVVQKIHLLSYSWDMTQQRFSFINAVYFTRDCCLYYLLCVLCVTKDEMSLITVYYCS